MGLFRKKNNDAEHLRMMQEQLVTMRERLDQADAAKSQLEERVVHLDAENQRLSTQVGDVEVQVVTVQGQVGAVEGRVGEVASAVGSMASKVGTVESNVGDVVSKVGSVEARVGEVDGKVSAVETRVGEVDGRVGDVDGRIDAVETKVGEVDGKVSSVETKVGEVDGKVSSVETRVGEVDGKIGAVEGIATAASVAKPVGDPRVDDVERRLAEQVAALAATVEEQRLHLADLALVAKDTAEKAAAIESTDTDHTPPRAVDDELRLQIGQIAEKMSALDGRVTQISVELANQLTELSSDLDAVNERGGDTAAIEQRLDEITSGQTRLANEQARYEIQFRNDLAELVERLRRPGTA
jgi:chromosome segregation ATPase